MINFNYIKENDLIGITALSSGASSCPLEMNNAIDNIKKEGFPVKTTDNVYGGFISSSVDVRIKELNELLDNDINALIVARGGDFLYETLPYIDYEKIVSKKIPVMGYSDPTSLLYILTTKYDYKTIYGLNAKTFYKNSLSSKNSLEIMKGNKIIQTNFNNQFKSINGNFKETGILIGGCIEVLRNLIGTSFDNTLNFIEKYKDNKIIWYFDLFDISPTELYLTLLQLKNIGWFKYTNTFLFSKPCFEKYDYLNIEDAVKKALGDNNIVINMMFGHNDERLVFINGSIVEIDVNENGYIIGEM